ncbi:hypothetical protein [Amphritea sp.]|uniref:hypothetical protein n=1 Tax=Amphritea sp. TaxID=1872502 RepID=UPI003D1214DE
MREEVLPNTVDKVRAASIRQYWQASAKPVQQTPLLSQYYRLTDIDQRVELELQCAAAAISNASGRVGLSYFDLGTLIQVL